MKKMTLKRTFVAVATAATLVLGMGLLGCNKDNGSQGGTDQQPDGTEQTDATTPEPEPEASYYPHTFVDMDGNTVTIQQEPQVIAALVGGSYSSIMWFDTSWADKIVTSMQLSDNQWLQMLCPPNANMTQHSPKENRNPNVEELASLGVDTVFYWADLDDIVAQMEELGMTVVQTSGGVSMVFDSVDAIVAYEMSSYTCYAEVMNGTEKLAAYEKYVRDMLTMIQERTATLADDQKPTVYMIRSGEDGLTYFPWAGGNTNPWLAELAGGTYCTHDTSNGAAVSATATMEQILEWNPDYVFQCWQDSIDSIMNDPGWQGTNAVQNNHVILCPAAESTALCTPLFTLFVAMTLHPDLYTDIDFAAEVQNYYSTFWGFDMTYQQAQYVVQRLNPDGSARS